MSILVGTVIGALIVFLVVFLVTTVRLSKQRSQALDDAIGDVDRSQDLGPSISESKNTRIIQKRSLCFALIACALMGLGATTLWGALAEELPKPAMIVSLEEVTNNTCPGGTVATGDSCLQVGAPGMWVAIERGQFFMGTPPYARIREDDEVRHSVRLTHDIVIMDSEVTQGQFHSMMGYNPSRYSSCGLDCPVESVSWHEAAAYTNELSRREGLEECYSCGGDLRALYCDRLESPYICEGYRLPTEAEWEYAARGGDISYELRKDAEIDEVAWSLDNSRVDYSGSWPIADGSGPQKVRTRQANRWMLHDTLGNVAEWCHDYLSTYVLYGTVDPYGAGSGAERVIRGGSWWDARESIRVSDRDSRWPGAERDTLGFRAVRSI